MDRSVHQKRPDKQYRALSRYLSLSFWFNLALWDSLPSWKGTQFNQNPLTLGIVGSHSISYSSVRWLTLNLARQKTNKILVQESLAFRKCCRKSHPKCQMIPPTQTFDVAHQLYITSVSKCRGIIFEASMITHSREMFTIWLEFSIKTYSSSW